MLEAEIWEAVDLQRTRTAGLLEGLAPAAWDRASLCAGWRVRDVAAHLTQQQQRLGDVVRSAVRHPGGLNRVIRFTAIDKANRIPTDRLIAELRASIGSRRTNLGVTRLETLTDIVVHGQDIALPPGSRLDVSPDVAASVAARVWSCRGSLSSRVFVRSPLDGVRLVADDAAWHAGEGSELRAPALSLVLILTGRPVGLENATGPGAAVLRRRLSRDVRDGAPG